MLSNDPKLKLERLLVFSALGVYLLRHFQLQNAGQLGSTDNLMVNVDKKKVFDLAERQFKMNPVQRQALEGLYDRFAEKSKK